MCFWSKKLLILLGFSMLLSVSAFAGNDWQYWGHLKATHKLKPDTTISNLFGAYFRDDMSDDYVYFNYLTYSKKLKNGFGLFAQNYSEWVESATKGWNDSHNLVGGLTYTFGKEIKVKLQERVYYKYSEDPGFNYHRPRITLSKDLGSVTLSVSDEMRVDLSGDRKYNFFRNRIFVTLSRKLNETTSLGVGFIRQEDKTAQGWKSFDVFQTTLSMSF
ncbi:MAG: DUF2490 domain-containing protein [Candidatus Rifleibacteriota bacterium]